MEENKGLEMGVEDTSVANLETEEVTNEEVVSHESLDKEGVQAEATETVKADKWENKVEKAFSKRLSKEQEKIRKELATEYEGKLTNYERVLASAAKEYGITTEEYVQGLLDQYEGEEQEGVTPPLDSETMELLEELKAQKTEKELEKESKVYWDRQAKQLMDIGVTDLSKIPDEVIERALENDTEIAFEYLKYDKQLAIENARKETIRNIQETASSGSLTSGGTDEGLNLSKMKWNDPKFEELKKQVLSGKKISL